jgi:hypothetical protein
MKMNLLCKAIVHGIWVALDDHPKCGVLGKVVNSFNIVFCKVIFQELHAIGD